MGVVLTAVLPQDGVVFAGERFVCTLTFTNVPDSPAPQPLAPNGAEFESNGAIGATTRTPSLAPSAGRPLPSRQAPPSARHASHAAATTMDAASTDTTTSSSPTTNTTTTTTTSNNQLRQSLPHFREASAASASASAHSRADSDLLASFAPSPIINSGEPSSSSSAMTTPAPSGSSSSSSLPLGLSTLATSTTSIPATSSNTDAYAILPNARPPYINHSSTTIRGSNPNSRAASAAPSSASASSSLPATDATTAVATTTTASSGITQSLQNTLSISTLRSIAGSFFGSSTETITAANSNAQKHPPSNPHPQQKLQPQPPQPLSASAFTPSIPSSTQSPRLKTAGLPSSLSTNTANPTSSNHNHHHQPQQPQQQHDTQEIRLSNTRVSQTIHESSSSSSLSDAASPGTIDFISSEIDIDSPAHRDFGKSVSTRNGHRDSTTNDETGDFNHNTSNMSITSDNDKSVALDVTTQSPIHVNDNDVLDTGGKLFLQLAEEPHSEYIENRKRNSVLRAGTLTELEIPGTLLGDGDDVVAVGDADQGGDDAVPMKASSEGLSVMDASAVVTKVSPVRLDHQSLGKAMGATRARTPQPLPSSGAAASAAGASNANTSRNATTNTNQVSLQTSPPSNAPAATTSSNTLPMLLTTPLATNTSQYPVEEIAWAFAQMTGQFTIDPAFVKASAFEPLRQVVMYRAAGMSGGQGGGGSLGIGGPGPGMRAGSSGVSGIGGAGSISNGGGGIGMHGRGSISTMRHGTFANTTTPRNEIPPLPLYTTPPSILFCDETIPPNESKSFKYEITLPITLPPSHRGKIARFYYKLIVGIQRSGKSRQSQIVSIPFRVFGRVHRDGVKIAYEMMDPVIVNRDEASVIVVDVALSNHRALTSPLSSTVPLGMRLSGLGSSQSSSIDLEDYTTTMNNIMNFCQNSKKVSYEICKNNEHVAQVTLPRVAYRLGETIIAVINFSKASIPCLHLSAFLESVELVDMAFALRTKSQTVFHTRRCHTEVHRGAVNSRRLVLSVAIPSIATADFTTTAVSVQWSLRLEFVTGKSGGGGLCVGVGDSGGGFVHVQGATRVEVEPFDCTIPLKIFGGMRALKSTPKRFRFTVM